MRALQQVVDGLATGSIYGALALALVLVHRATGVVNFAQGQMAVISAFIAWTLTRAGVPVALAVLLAAAVSFPFGAAVERFVIRRFESEAPLVAIVVTAGLLVFLNGLAGEIWGHDLKNFPAVFSTAALRAGGLAIAIAAIGNVAVLVVTVVLLQLLFRRTRLGLALRAVADNPESSALSGLPVGRLLMAGWGLAAAFGALAGGLIAPKVGLEPGMLGGVLVYALAAAILGGMDSPLGAVVAAWIIGVTENLAGTYIGFIGNDLRVAVPLALIVLVLLFRPQGLFGQREEVRV